MVWEATAQLIPRSRNFLWFYSNDGQKIDSRDLDFTILPGRQIIYTQRESISDTDSQKLQVANGFVYHRRNDLSRRYIQL